MICSECNIKKDYSGFTLVEVLVALFIFSTISVIAFAGLQSVLRSRQVIEDNVDRMIELRKGMRVLQRDIEQSVARPVRGEFGDLLYSMHGNKEEQILDFTRTGRLNPAGLKRSHLQRVRYMFSDGALMRGAWNTLDGGSDEQRRDFVLFSQVSEFSFRFLSSDDKWSDSWPIDSDEEDMRKMALLPKAVEIAITFSDLGEVKRIFAIAGAQPGSE
ncbi:MAG: type II secretion system protein GspJ [Gammaproteobacteria bacterium]|nr:MAG: type II secretion system protein GspJ [Gammaproteobacteria bacterium]